LSQEGIKRLDLQWSSLAVQRYTPTTAFIHQGHLTLRLSLQSFADNAHSNHLSSFCCPRSSSIPVSDFDTSTALPHRIFDFDDRLKKKSEPHIFLVHTRFTTNKQPWPALLVRSPSATSAPRCPLLCPTARGRSSSRRARSNGERSRALCNWFRLPICWLTMRPT
jgi:hypothetical protein